MDIVHCTLEAKCIVELQHHLLSCIIELWLCFIFELVDNKFSVKARLYQTLGLTLDLLLSNSSNPRLLLPITQVLKLYAGDGWLHYFHSPSAVIFFLDSPKDFIKSTEISNKGYLYQEIRLLGCSCSCLSVCL